MKKRLLISDMDHTLLDDRPGVSRENLDAIARHVEGGGLFTVATGRAPAAIRVFPEILPYLNLPCVTGNGGQVCDIMTDHVYYRRTLPDGAEFVLYDLLERFPLVGVVSYYGLEGFDDLRHNDYITDLIRREGRPPRVCAPEESPLPWNKLLLSMEHGYLEEIDAYLKPRLAGIARTVFSEECFLEILPLGATKGSALKYILDMYGIEPQEVVAVGDALNDLEMIQLAGIGAAVSNACPELKTAADAVVCSNNEHAVRDCLERFF
ncbi:MAG: HAD family phosphatase [Clostridia bacterium]|nr:HAD family phosphatase [Clostridia bacterium]